MKNIKNFEFYSAKGTKSFFYQTHNNGLSKRYWIEIPYLFGFTISIKIK